MVTTFGELTAAQRFVDHRRPDNPIVYVKEGYGGKAVEEDNPNLFVYFNDADEVEPLEDRD